MSSLERWLRDLILKGGNYIDGWQPRRAKSRYYFPKHFFLSFMKYHCLYMNKEQKTMVIYLDTKLCICFENWSVECLTQNTGWRLFQSTWACLQWSPAWTCSCEAPGSHGWLLVKLPKGSVLFPVVCLTTGQSSSFRTARTPRSSSDSMKCLISRWDFGQG